MLDLVRLICVFVVTPVLLIGLGWLLKRLNVIVESRARLRLALFFLYVQVLLGMLVAVGSPRWLDVTHGFVWMSIAGILGLLLSSRKRVAGKLASSLMSASGPLLWLGASGYVLLGLLSLEVPVADKIVDLLPLVAGSIGLVFAGKEIDSSEAGKAGGYLLGFAGQIVAWISVCALTSSVFFWLVAGFVVTGLIVSLMVTRAGWVQLFSWCSWYLGVAASMALLLGYRDDNRAVYACVFGGVVMSLFVLIPSIRSGLKASFVRRSSLGSFALASLLVSVALTSGIACTPLRPGEAAQGQGPQDIQGNGIKFQLAGAALRSLIDDGSEVHIQVIRLVRNADGSESLGDKEGNERVSKLTSDSQEFLIDQLEVGRKEVQISIMSSLEDQVGYGALRVSVGLGLNEVREQLNIQLLPFEKRRRDWDAAVDVSFIVQGHENEVIYSEVKDIIDRKCANSCHNAAAFKGELDLTSFPFRSEHMDTQEEIVKESLMWMADLTYPMPPAPEERVPTSDIAAIKAWLDSGLPVKHSSSDELNALVERVCIDWTMQGSPQQTGQIDLTSAGNMRFTTAMRSMQIGGKYDLKISVMGPSGILLKSESFPDLMLRGKGAFERAIRIQYEPPTLRVPIIVTP